MSKFKIKMKLQGLELEIEGSREDMPIISQNIGQQMAGLLQPAGAIIEGEVVSGRVAAPAILASESPETPKRKTQRRRSQGTSGGTSGKEASDAVDWRHDSSKFGMPKQDWSLVKKSIWLLYVVLEETKTAEMSAGQIERTFNKHFRQAGAIRGSNVSKYLGQQKVT